MPIPAHYTEFGYDADGARYKKAHNGRVTLYLGDGVEVTQGVYTKWVHLGRQLLAKVVAGDIGWLYTDHLGSVRAVENASGQLICQEAYSAYGEPLSGCTAGGASFTGEQLDETGLVYLNARYYDPSIGQFISADSVVPSMWPMGMNRYAYAYGNPIFYIDPSGHWAMVNTLGVLQAVGGGLEIAFGVVAGVTVGWTGVGGFAAGGMIVMGADTMIAGFRTAASGSPAVPFSQQGFTQLGRSAGMRGGDAANFGFGMFTALNVGFGSVAGAAVSGGSAGLAVSLTGSSSGGLAVGISVSAQGISGAALGAGVGLLGAASTGASNGGGDYRQKTRGANRNDRKMVDDAARRAGVEDRHGFRQFIHKTKKRARRGATDNYTWRELLDLAYEYKATGGR